MLDVAILLTESVSLSLAQLPPVVSSVSATPPISKFSKSSLTLQISEKREHFFFLLDTSTFFSSQISLTISALFDGVLDASGLGIAGGITWVLEIGAILADLSHLGQLEKTAHTKPKIGSVHTIHIFESRNYFPPEFTSYFHYLE